MRASGRAARVGAPLFPEDETKLAKEATLAWAKCLRPNQIRGKNRAKDPTREADGSTRKPRLRGFLSSGGRI